MIKFIKMKRNHFQVLILLISILLISRMVEGQNKITDFTTDSVDLQKVVSGVISTHPTILNALEAINKVKAGIGLANSGYYPDIDLGAGYSRIGPVPSITIPNMGSFDMAPADNYNATVNVRQTVYDFSKTKTNIQAAESGKDITEKNVDLVKQKLSELTIVNYYTLAYLQEAIHIRNIQLDILNQHLDFVNRKKETGSATDYEILSTKVRISVAKNQKLDIETALNNQLAILNSLLGLPEDTRIRVRNRPATQIADIQYDSLVNYALSHRNELILDDLRRKQAELHLHSIKIENNPVISAFVSAGIKDGYFPDLIKPKANYVAGFGIKIPIYTASRHQYNLQIASSDINSIKQDLEQNRRDVSSEVYRNLNNLQASMRKIDESELQLEQAAEARKLADLSFKAGSLTNLDLLDSESLEAESRLNLMRARTDFMINSARLEISIGKQGY